MSAVTSYVALLRGRRRRRRRRGIGVLLSRRRRGARRDALWKKPSILCAVAFGRSGAPPIGEFRDAIFIRY